MKSTSSGNSGQFRGTEGNVSGGLITQRSQVQILPPQPTEAKALSVEVKALEAVTKPVFNTCKLLILKLAAGYRAFDSYKSRRHCRGSCQTPIGASFYQIRHRDRLANYLGIPPRTRSVSQNSNFANEMPWLIVVCDGNPWSRRSEGNRRSQVKIKCERRTAADAPM
jgi:hypothetical protein